MKLVIFDTETTGLNLKEDKIIDLAAVIYDTKHKTICDVFNRLILRSNLVLTNNIISLTGITNEMLFDLGRDEQACYIAYLNFILGTDYILSHNYFKFDGPILKNNMKSYMFELPKETTALDSLIDVPYPKSIKIRQLKYLAMEHGYIMAKAHRALDDVLALTHIISKYDFKDILNYSQEEQLELIAPKDVVNFQNRHLAKDNGFHFNGEAKEWVRIIKQHELQDVLEQLEFTPAILPVFREKN